MLFSEFFSRFLLGIMPNCQWSTIFNQFLYDGLVFQLHNDDHEMRVFIVVAWCVQIRFLTTLPWNQFLYYRTSRSRWCFASGIRNIKQWCTLIIRYGVRVCSTGQEVLDNIQIPPRQAAQRGVRSILPPISLIDDGLVAMCLHSCDRVRDPS